MTTFTTHPAFNQGPSFSDRLRWASDRAPRAIFPAAMKTEIMDEAARNKVQVNDSGKSGDLSFYTGHRRTDVDDFWKPRLLTNRAHWRSGLYGASPFAVNYDRQLANMEDKNIESSPWNLWGGLTAGQDEEWKLTDLNPVVGMVKYNAKAIRWLSNNWNFDSVIEMTEQVDPTFKDFKTDGWIDALNKEFGKQADLARKALEQNGWDPESHGIGTKNAQAYTYLAKRRLRDIYLQQWAQSRYDYQDYITGENSNKVFGDIGKGLLVDIFTDYEIALDTVVTIPLTGGVGTLLKTGGEALKAAGRIKRLAGSIRKGKYSAMIWDTIDVPLGVGKGVRKVKVLHLTDSKGIVKTAPIFENEVLELRKLGVLKDVPLIGKKLVTGKMLVGESRLAQRFAQGTSEKLISSMGWGSIKLGSVAEFLAFQNASRSVASLGHTASASGIWGAATGVGWSIGSQKDRRIIADLTYGIGNHDVTFSGGEAVQASLLFGGAGFVLGGVLSGLFRGSFYTNFWNSARKHGWNPSEMWKNRVLGHSPTTTVDGTPEGLIKQLTKDHYLKFLADILDQTAGETGHGARLLDDAMFEKNHLLADDVGMFLEYIYKKLNGNYIPIEALEPIIMRFIADAGKHGPANLTERLAMNKKRAAELWRKARKNISEEKGKPAIEVPVPERDHSGLNTFQRTKLTTLQNDIDTIRKRANREKKNGRVEDETHKAYDEAIDALEKWYEKEGIDFLPTEMIPEIRFKDYNFSVTEEGAFLAKLIQIAESIEEAGWRGAPKKEIKGLEQDFARALESIDKTFARRDKKTRLQALEDDINILMPEIRKAGDEGQALVKEKLLNLLVKKLGAESPQGDHAKSGAWFDRVMRSGPGKGLTKIATLGSGYSSMVYSIAHEIRLLARMIDSSHEALADDIALFGRMRSVWSAQRQAFRDGGHVVTAVNRAETELGVVSTNVIQDIVSAKRLAGEAITAEDFSRAGFNFRDTVSALKHAEDISKAVQTFFGSNLERGVEVQLLKKAMDSDRYISMMFVDTLPDSEILRIGREAWEIQAKELWLDKTVAWVELEALGLLNLAKDEGGNILGIHSIPEDSFFNVGLPVQEIEKLLTKLSREDLRAWQGLADRNRIAQGLDVHPNRLDNLTATLEKKRLDINKVSPETVESYYKGSKGRYLVALGENNLPKAAKELYTLQRQISEFKRFNPESSVEHSLYLKEHLQHLEKEYGITIVDPMSQPYTKDVTWIVDKWHSDPKPGALTKDPVVIAVNHPEVRRGTKILKEARVVVTDIVGAQDIPAVGYMKDLADSIGVVEKGQKVVHTPVSGEPRFTEPLVIEKIVIKTSTEDLDATRVLRANEIYKDKYQGEVEIGALTKDEARRYAMEDATRELKKAKPEEYTHTMVKVEGIDDLIPSHELQTVGRNLTPDEFDGAAKYLRYNSLYNAEDYDMLGAHDLMTLVEALSGTTLSPIEIGITKRALRNSGITSSDLTEHLTTSQSMRELFSLAMQNDIDISTFIPAYLQKTIQDASKVNRRNVVTWLNETNPKPAKSELLKAIGTPDRVKEAVDLINKRIYDLEDLLPESSILVERGVISLDDDGVASLLKPLQGEDLEVYTAAVNKVKSKYESRLTTEQLGLIRREEWDTLAATSTDILHKIHEIKQGFINDNLARISSGEASVNNRIAMTNAIEEEFPGLKLWDPADDISDDIFRASVSKWENSFADAHGTGLHREASDFVGPPKPTVEIKQPKVVDPITPEEMASHMASDTQVGKVLDESSKKNAKHVTQSQRVQKYFPESTSDQLKDRKYIASKMAEVKRLEYLDNVDARITSDLNKVSAAISEVEERIGALRELPPEVMKEHSDLLVKEMILRTDLAEAKIKREFGGYDKDVEKLEKEILDKVDDMLALDESDLALRIKGDRLDFEESLPSAYRGMSPEDIKQSIVDLKEVRSDVIKRKKKYKKDSPKYNKALGEERALSGGINKLEASMDIADQAVTSISALQDEMSLAVAKLEDRILKIHGTRKFMDPKADEVITHIQNKLDKNIKRQTKLIPLNTLEDRMDRLMLDRERLNYIKTLRDENYDLTDFSKGATLMELLDTKLHWWEQGKLAKEANAELKLETEALHKELARVEQKVFGTGEHALIPERKRTGTVGDYIYLMSRRPERAEEYLKGIAVAALSYAKKKGWIATEANTSIAPESLLGQEMEDILQDFFTMATLPYHKYNTSPVEQIVAYANASGNPMTPHNADYLAKNLFSYERVLNPDTGKYFDRRVPKKRRFRGGEDSKVPMGLLIYQAANEIRRRRGGLTKLLQYPEARKHANSPYDDLFDPDSGDWAGSIDRFADPFGYEYGSTFGKPLASLEELAGREQFNEIVKSYFGKTAGLTIIEQAEKDRQYALVRLIMEQDKGGSRILRRGRERTVEEELSSREVRVKKDRVLREEEFPHRSEIYRKDGVIRPDKVAKMLRDRGFADASVATVRSDINALKNFYADSLSIFKEVEGSVRILNSSPETFRKWLDKAFSGDTHSFMGKPSQQLIDVKMDGKSLMDNSKYYLSNADELEVKLLGSVLSEGEREAVIQQMKTHLDVYTRDYDRFLDNIVIYGSDPISYMKNRMMLIEEELSKPRFTYIEDNKWFVKHGWARPDRERAFVISKGDYARYNKLQIEKAVLRRKLSNIKKDIYTTLARDIEQFEVPVVAKWLPDAAHGDTMFKLKDLLDTDAIRKKDFLAMHKMTDAQWKSTIYPHLVKLRKEGFVDTVNKRWQLTEKGRNHVDANEPIVINVHTPRDSFSPVVNKELLSNTQAKKLLGLSDSSTIKIQARDKQGFTKAMRQQYNNMVTLKRQSIKRGDLKMVAMYESQIRALKAQAITAETEVGMMLMKELRQIYKELEDIRNMRMYGQEVGPNAFKKFKNLTKVYEKGMKRAQFLEVRKHQIIDSLQEILGKKIYKDGAFAPPTSSVFSTSKRKLMSTADVGEDVGTTSSAAGLIEKLEKAGIDPEKINPNYRGSTDALTADEKYGEALTGISDHYTGRAKEKYKNNMTALQDGLWAWSRRMNGERAGTGSGFDPIMAGKYRNPDGSPHMGDHSRVFSAELLVKYPEFRKNFETDLRKIVANYSRTMGAQIRAQEVLNDWMKHLMVGVDQKYLKNIRWDDIFDLIEARVNNMTEIINKSGTMKIGGEERRSLVDAVKLAKHAYYDMIGRPYHEGWMEQTSLVKAANNVAQSMFGPGISTAVALVEFPMAILARSGDLGGLVNGMGIAARNVKHMNTLERSDLEGTSFVLDNYVHSGLHRHLSSIGDDLESRVSTRIRMAWSKMFEGSERVGTMDKVMENINNFLEGTAKIGSELSGLRQAINLVKAVAVGKAKYTIMKNVDGLMKFGELLDIHKIKTASTPGERVKYIKGIARKAGVNPTLAFRWYRAGLVGDNDGILLGKVVKNLLGMGSTLEGKSFDLGLMYRGMVEMEHTVGAGKALYEDVFDRLALFLELHAHDLSPEPRGLVRFGMYNSPLGRLFAFYASYPISFFMAYFKKNPSEMGTIGALATILTLTGFEAFHMQVRALQRGDDWDEVAEKWKENPWAMLFRHGSNTPWLGYTNGLIRETVFLPGINKILGDRDYPVSVGHTAGLGAVTKLFDSLRDVVKGNLLTRGANNASSNMRSIDRLMTGFDLESGGESAQASKFFEVLYDTMLPTKAFYWVLIDKMFDYEFDPQVSDNQEVIMRAYRPILEALEQSGDSKEFERIMRELNKEHFSNKRIHPSMPSRETPLFPQQRKDVPTPTGPMPEFYKPKSVPQVNPQDVVASLLKTPTYSSIPEDLV